LGNSITANAEYHAVVGARQGGKVENCYFTAPTLSDPRAKLMPMEAEDNTNFLTLLSARDKFLSKGGGLTNEQIGYDITVNGRTLSAKQQADGTWKSMAYPICWPFEVNILEQFGDIEDLKLYTAHMVDLDSKVLQFTNDVPMIEAGKPYVIVINKGSFTLTGKNVTIVTDPKEPQTVYSTADHGKQIGWWKGTFKKIDNDGAIAENAHIIQNDGMFKRITKKYPHVYVNPYRGYFSTIETLAFADFFTKYKHTEDGMEEGDETDFPADEYDVDFVFGDETGLSSIIQTIDSDGTSHYYDLQGRQLNGKLNKGVYIKNGKKILIK